MFTEKERLLANEADLTRAMLVSGLNSLRRAKISLKGEYYQAFFSLSIGFERMLKVIYIRDYRAKHNGDFPEGEDLKKLSHNLIKLWDEVGMNKLERIHKEILEFLDAFAGYARYYNIDIMGNRGGKNQQKGDILERWSHIQKKILDSSGKERYMPNNQKFVKMLDEKSVVGIYNLEGQLLTSLSGLIHEEINIEIIQGYSVQYVFEIIKMMYYKIVEIEKQDYRMPIIKEFFSYFTDYWKPYQIRNRKNWLNQR